MVVRVSQSLPCIILAEILLDPTQIAPRHTLYPRSITGTLMRPRPAVEFPQFVSPGFWEGEGRAIE